MDESGGACSKVCGGESQSDREQAETLVGEGEVLRPRPVFGETEQHLARPVHEPPGGVQEPVAQRAWFGSGEVAVEADALAPGKKVGGGEDQFHPGGVGGESGEGHAFEAAVLEVADAVLHLGMTTVAKLEGDVVAFAIGEHDLVPQPVVVPQAQLGAGVRFSRRQMARVPGGHPSKVMSSSATCAPRRSLPLASCAGTHVSRGTAAMAASNEAETRPPTENSQLRATSPSMNARTAPAVSARTNTGCSTDSTGSPGRCPARQGSGSCASAWSTTVS